MFNFASYVFSVGYMVMAVASIPAWKRELRKCVHYSGPTKFIVAPDRRKPFSSASALWSLTLSCSQTSITPMPSRSRAMSQLYDTRGKKMYFNAQEEKEIYFSQLKLAWN